MTVDLRKFLVISFVLLSLVFVLRWSFQAKSTKLIPGIRGSSTSNSLHFSVIGDWGTGQPDQYRVAQHLGAEASRFLPAFIVSTGDQMYGIDDASRANGLDGVASVDDPGFQNKFENVYSGAAFKNLPWYMTLGNHDCAGNATAQLLYTQHSPTKLWNLPQRYYSFQKNIGNSRNVVQFVVLDSCTLACDKGTNDRCSYVQLDSNDDDKHQQLLWLQRTLRQELPTKNSFFVIVSHWPIFSTMGNGPTEVMIREVEPMLAEASTRYKTLWFNGHDHGLQHIQRQANHYFVSGGGGFKIHHGLKHTADGAYKDTQVDRVRSKWNELENVEVRFSKGCHGFMNVQLHPDGNGEVEIFESVQGEKEPTLLYTAHI
jgi:hypothetical protein